MRSFDNTVGLLVAVALHGVLAMALLGMKATFPQPTDRRRLTITLEPASERARPMYLIASLPLPASEQPQPLEPVPPTDNSGRQPSVLDDNTRRELEAERDELRKRLRETRELALLPLPEAKGVAVTEQAGTTERPDAGPVGTIRELDLTGWPQAIVDRVMARYRLRVTEKVVTGASNQNFLSSAATSKDNRYYASRDNQPGLYQVFELSRDAVAVMSRLEEQEIRRRNLDIERTRVTRVKFGIVESGTGEYDLGIVSFEAAAVP
jgi:hypothetical protein